jgi:hypothetical protein
MADGVAVSDRIRRRLGDVDDPRSVSSKMRGRRWQTLMETFPGLAEMSVVDLGGTLEHWAHAPVRPRRLVLLNFGSQITGEAEGVETVIGDACDPPEDLRGEGFDLVYSNSVLEHVGGPYRRQQFADTVNALAHRHWIQTPYRYFPIEPHWMFPGFQFLPVAGRVQVMKRWPIGQRRSSDPAKVMQAVLEVELVGATEMRHIFPHSHIHQERFAGITKSMIALKTA